MSIEQEDDEDIEMGGEPFEEGEGGTKVELMLTAVDLVWYHFGQRNQAIWIVIMLKMLKLP